VRPAQLEKLTGNVSGNTVMTVSRMVKRSLVVIGLMLRGQYLLLGWPVMMALLQACMNILL
jgi:hypothetical protein